MGFHYHRLKALKPADQLKYLSQQIQRFSSFVARQLRGETLQQKAQREWTARSHQTVRAYTPERPYSGRVCFYFNQINNASSNHLGDRGWEKIVSKSAKVELFEGDHFSLVKEPDVQILADKLKTALSSSRTG
ncbi:hypothetical protein H6F89_25620 [Cyanobacteria bacterium FACHB-63]|nr:hypothetical protein [Cyanobacteria bacterium FACHB-63]